MIYDILYDMMLYDLYDMIYDLWYDMMWHI